MEDSLNDPILGSPRRFEVEVMMELDVGFQVGVSSRLLLVMMELDVGFQVGESG